MTAGDGQPEMPVFQLEVARLFFALPASKGFLLAGGAALLAQHLTARPTEDLDFFTAQERGHVPAARDALEAAARQRGWSTERIHDSDTFCRMIVTIRKSCGARPDIYGLTCTLTFSNHTISEYLRMIVRSRIASVLRHLAIGTDSVRRVPPKLVRWEAYHTSAAAAMHRLLPARQVAEAYKAMDERRAIKALLQP